MYLHAISIKQMVPRCEEKDTNYEDLRELLDAESFGAFPSGFAFGTRLRESHREAVRRWCWKIHISSLQGMWNVYTRPLTGLSSPSNTSSFVKSLKQSLRVTSPEFFCGDTKFAQSIKSKLHKTARLYSLSNTILQNIDGYAIWKKPCMCVLTCAIGIDRSQNGSNTVERKPQSVQVRELFSCPTNRSKARNNRLRITLNINLRKAQGTYAAIVQIHLPTTLLSSLSKYIFHIRLPFSSSLWIKNISYSSQILGVTYLSFCPRWPRSYKFAAAQSAVFLAVKGVYKIVGYKCLTGGRGDKGWLVCRLTRGARSPQRTP